MRTPECKLCMAEKCELVSRLHKGKRVMNANSEIYGPCRHKARFHRFHQSTDERGEREKGCQEDSDVESDTDEEDEDWSSQVIICPVIADGRSTVIEL